MNKTKVVTHRGLDPSRTHYFAESSVEAFTDQLERGYGLEFDLRVTKDKKVVIIHDASLTRITNGKDEREIRALAADEILAMDFDGSHITTLDHLLYLIETKQKEGSVSLMHLKIGSQGKEDLDVILSYLREVDLKKFYIFDTTIATAAYLKERNPDLRIAPSVAHSYDIERYNKVVGGTLLSVEEVLTHHDLFDGVWLDEWDLVDRGGGVKKFYTQEVFEVFRNAGLWIGLVTPELHGTSPGLLGGEAHADAKPFETLALRLQEIVALNPDAICTDYPDYVRNLIYQS